jgi:ATP-dependent helicase/nuclease subunit B
MAVVIAEYMSLSVAIVTRALKRGGAPTTPSRFLLRLQALAGEAWPQCQGRGAHYLALSRMLDAPGKHAGPIGRPAPVPDLNLRPRSLSVTAIETLRPANMKPAF